MAIKKIFTCLLIFIFTFNQVCFAGDRAYYKYEYSVVKDLLTSKSDIDKSKRMAPPLLLRMQKRHEELIRAKNLIEEEILFVLDSSSYLNEKSPPLPLKRKINSPSGDNRKKRVEYTLSDYDGAGKPQQISVYTYDSDGKTLKKIESYDVRDTIVSHLVRDDLEEISEEGEPKVMASYEKGEYLVLTDDIKLKTVVYFGKTGEEKIDYILSDYRGGKANEVSFYTYENANILREVNVYDISLWEGLITEIDSTWKEEAKSNGHLTRKTVYEGTSGNEKAVYALSEYDSGSVPGKVECFDYKSGNEGALERARTYNIKGLDWQMLLSDFRLNKRTCDNRLISTVVYKGKKDKEIVDYVFGAYYADELGHNYKPSRRSDYVYDSNGRLERVETFCIKNGANILRSCSEFLGLKGHEVIARSYNYKTDGKTLHSVSLYEYDLEPDVNNNAIGGDGNKYTLDRVTRYVGTDNPDDLSAAKVRSETYYDGPEGEEYVTYSFGFDILTGDVLTRTEYDYEGKSLERVNTYRILDPGVLYELDEGVLVAQTDYDGGERREKAALSTTYDLSGAVLTKTYYDYDPSGALRETITRDSSEEERVLSRTLYAGAENREKKTITKNFDLQEKRTTKIRYEYSIIDALEKAITFNPDNIKVSETEYEGIEGDEKTSLTTRYDFSGTTIGTIEYEYDAGGALSEVINKDDNGRMLSKVSHEGPENYVRAIFAKNYDLEGSLLSETTYNYEPSGALSNTVTEGFADEECTQWVKFSLTEYTGRMNRENMTTITNYDLLGEELTFTEYVYDDSEAINKTITKGYEEEERETLYKFSETDYVGLMGHERIDSTKSYDLEGAVLAATHYDYDEESGAIERTITYNPQNRKIAESIHEGLKGRERVARSEGYNLAGEKLNVTIYSYAGSGALSSTATYDQDDVKLFETTYKGPMGRERNQESISFKDNGNDVLNSTTYQRDSSGAIYESVTKNAGGRVLSETSFTGLSGREKNHVSENNDSSGELKTVIYYIYGSNGALDETQTNAPDDITLLSRTYYYGLKGYEISDFTLNYRDDGTVKNSVYYFYKSFDAGTASYLIVRAEDAFREDPLVRAETYEGGDQTGDPAGLLLESVAYYKGEKGKEVIDFSQEYEFKPDDNTQRQIRTTTIYEYDEERALVKSYTYARGVEASRDTAGLKRNYMSKYEGEKGEEQIWYMEGTTCEYNLGDYTEWDYFVRTDFSYDDENRNTGYFEEIFTPETEWDWSGDTTATLIEAKDVRFSEFDEKDRYGRIEKTYFDRAGPEEAYVETGKKNIQESFEYDLDDNIISYLETNIDPEDETRRYKFTFENYSDKKPGTITSWELDENYLETGDYFKKNDLKYDQYARVTSYTATSCKDGETSISDIFDITYDKNIAIRENVWTEGEILYFGQDHPTRGYKYSTREYKYNQRKKVETTILSNGDFISISDADGKNIYFEWTPEMAPYRERDFVSEQEPEGAGPRAGSQTPSNPVADILQEIRKCAAHDEIIGQTSITYTEGGQIADITDIKGNSYVYSDNKLVELRDNAGTVMATVGYNTLDEVLTVSMESAFDDTSAVYKYNKDNRKISVNTVDSTGIKEKSETYVYTNNDGKIESVEINKEYKEDKITVWTLHKKETYDDNELLVQIFTLYDNEVAEKHYVARWTVGDEGYDAEDRLIDSRKTRCNSSSLSFRSYEESQLNNLLNHFTNEEFSHPDITEDVIQDFGKGSVLIANETWAAEYEDGNIKNTTKNRKTYKYAPITNVIVWPGVSHDYHGGSNGPNSIDADFDTAHSGSVGRSQGITVWSEHTFDGPVDIKEIRFKIRVHANAWNYDEYGVDLSKSYQVYVIRGGVDELVASGGSSIERTIDVDMEGVEGVKIYASANNSIRGGKGDGSSIATIYEIQAINPDTDHFSFVKMSDTSTFFDAEEYDDKGNILRYSERQIKNNSSANVNGGEITEYQLATTTDWQATAYDVDRVTGFSQTVNKTFPAGTLNITEETTRRNIRYEKENIVSYDETFIPNTDEDLILERKMSGMTYADGRIEGYTEILDKYRKNGDSDPIYMTTTTTVRYGMVYDAWGNATSWTDEITTPTDVNDANSALRNVWQNSPVDSDLRVWFPNAGAGNYDGEGEWTGKTLVDWAQEVGYTQYDELYMYAPFELTFSRSNCTYDDNGRVLIFTDNETGYKDLAAGRPREWERKETIRKRTAYNAPNQIKSYTNEVILYERVVVDGKVEEAEKDRNTTGENNITYDEYGRKYSYNSFKDDETSRVDSSTYNSLGQLVKTHTRIDAYSYSKTYYFYDQAGNVSQTKYYYYYHQETEHSDRSSRYRVIQHYEKTIWYDKYGEKTSENTNQYTDVQVISKSFWSSFFGRTVISVISAVLSAIPAIGWALSLALNSSIALANGTFDLLSFGVQLLSAGLSSGFGGLLGFSPMEEMLKATPLAGFQDLWGGIGLGELTDLDPGSFGRFLFDAQIGAIQAVVAEGITEVGENNNWGSFLTSAVSGFASTAIGYAYGGMIGNNPKGNFNVGKFITATAVKSITESAINKYVENNPTAWSRVIAPIAKSAVNQMFTAPDKNKQGDKKPLEGLMRFVGRVKTFLSTIITGVLDLTGLSGRAADTAREAKAESVIVLQNIKDGETYMLFSLPDDLEGQASPLVQNIATDEGRLTLEQYPDLLGNKNLKMMMTEDGSKAYLLGGAECEDFKEGSLARNLLDSAGLKFGEKVFFVLNLKTGNLFLDVNVKNASTLLSEKNCQQNDDISKLKQVIIKDIGNIDNLSMKITVRINRDESEIVNARVIVDPESIEGVTLRGKVNDYFNFAGLRQDFFNVVLDIDPKNNRVDIKGLSLNLDGVTVNKLLESLKDQTAKLQKLGQEIGDLVKLVNGELKNFERITLSVNEKGDYAINVKMRSDALKALPALLFKLGIREGSPLQSDISGREFVDFVIDVESSVYILDFALKCQEYETIDDVVIEGIVQSEIGYFNDYISGKYVPSLGIYLENGNGFFGPAQGLTPEFRGGSPIGGFGFTAIAHADNGASADGGEYAPITGMFEGIDIEMGSKEGGLVIDATGEPEAPAAFGSRFWSAAFNGPVHFYNWISGKAALEIGVEGGKSIQVVEVYLERRDLGKRYSTFSLPNFSFADIIFNEIKYQVEGLVIDYEVDPDSEWLRHINQDSNIALWNGIGNIEPEGVPPTYEMRGKSHFTPIPMYEENSRNVDGGKWLLDEVLHIDVLTNEMRVKTSAYMDKISADRKGEGISDLAYSGSWNPKIKNLKYATSENKHIKALVGIGAVSFRGSWFTQKMYNPNLEVVVNMWGEKDLFYSKWPLSMLKLVGPKKFKGVPTYNVMILGADHGDYLNNDYETKEVKQKITAFTLKLADNARYGKITVSRYLRNTKAIFYNEKHDIYVVDPIKLNWSDIR
ncbi:MAG: hypothetical protein ACE5JK_00410 [Candidatus Omnitrophota bacterium]